VSSFFWKRTKEQITLTTPLQPTAAPFVRDEDTERLIAIDKGAINVATPIREEDSVITLGVIIVKKEAIKWQNVGEWYVQDVMTTIHFTIAAGVEKAKTTSSTLISQCCPV